MIALLQDCSNPSNPPASNSKNDVPLPPLPRGILSTSANGQPIDQAIMDNPYVDGFLVMQGWKDIEAYEGVFDYSHIDSEISRAKAAGKVVRLAIHVGGDDAPSWIFTNYPQVKKLLHYQKPSNDVIYIPAF